MFMNEQLVAASPDSTTVFVTGLELPGTIITAAYSAADGQQRWAARYQGTPQYSRGTPESLTLSPDGRHLYVVTLVQEDIGMCVGTEFHTNNHGTSMILAYDTATGALDWSGPTDPAAPADTLATCSLSSALSPDGSVLYTTGWQYVRSPDGQLDVTTITTAVDTAAGRALWRRESEADGKPTVATRLALDDAGEHLYVAGAAMRPDDIADESLVLAYDLTTAQPSLSWVARRPTQSLMFSTVAVAPDGKRVLEVRHEFEPNDAFAARIQVTAHEAGSGAVAWSRPVTGPGNPVQTDYAGAWHTPQSVVFSPDGSRAYVTGILAPRYQAGGTYVAQFPGGFLTASLDTATGVTGWTSVYRPPTGFSSILGAAIAAAPDGRTLYVTGHSMEGPSPSGIVRSTWAVSTLAYEAATGAQQWVALDLEHPGMTHSLAVSPDGRRVFAAGDATPDTTSSKFSMAVRAYDTATGALP
jgi:DNA-binding beta-propeller fold protein YncE